MEPMLVHAKPRLSSYAYGRQHKWQSALTSHFASPGKAIRSFPEALDSFSCLKTPHESGFDAGLMGGFKRRDCATIVAASDAKSA
jgi:hypothetical protein